MAKRSQSPNRSESTHAGKGAAGYALRAFARVPYVRSQIGKENVKDLLFATLIHSYRFKKKGPGLGQYSIGRVGQYSIGADRPGLVALSLAAMS